MEFKKLIMGALISSTVLFGSAIVAPSFNTIDVHATQTGNDSNQGEIVVKYRDQNGNVIRQATTVMGKSGTSFNAAIPDIPGYTFSNVENGENDSYGTKMIFGGPDNATNIMEMVLVYKQTGDTSAASSANKTANTKNESTASNSNSMKNSDSKNEVTGNNNQNKSNTSKVTKKANNGSNEKTSNKNNSGNNNSSKAEKNDKNSVNSSKKNKEPQKKNNSESADKSEKAEKSKPNNLLTWGISGIVLVLVAVILFRLYKFKTGSHSKH
ncbi:MucBP domain-containing protein [Fructilactobacillus vespulae]|uniref:MucBP domain-containing protein n=1 Tax=Fructilactobacillus vespulae TaxID=1249630 RepID=UPI0039B44156